MSKQGMLISVASDQEGATPRIVTETDSFPVHIQGIPNAVVNELFNLHTAVSSPIAVPSIAGDVQVEVDDTTGFNVGDVIELHDTIIETTFPTITALPGGNIIVLDRPLDFGYSVGDVAHVIHVDLSTTAGTLANPISHIVKAHVGQVWHIERIILSMTHVSAAADSNFGDISALTNGVVIRAYINGQFGTFTNWKNNRDIRLDMYDMEYTDKAGPSLFGTHGRGSFNRIGVTVRLDGNKGDYLEALVQDDLTGLSSFLINGQGHRGG